MSRTEEQKKRFNNNRKLKIFNNKLTTVKNKCKVDNILKTVNIDAINDTNEIDNAIIILLKLKAVRKQQKKLFENGAFIKNQPIKKKKIQKKKIKQTSISEIPLKIKNTSKIDIQKRYIKLFDELQIGKSHMLDIPTDEHEKIEKFKTIIKKTLERLKTLEKLA
jgi:hypothetical protein